MAFGANPDSAPIWEGNAMKNILEQADAPRQTASELRRHATEPEVSEPMVAFKLAERLDVRAAEREHRWLTLGWPSKSDW